MDYRRARQILDAEGNIEVFFHGSPVWIEGVSDNGMAEVTTFKGGRARREVPVTMLIERT